MTMLLRKWKPLRCYNIVKMTVLLYSALVNPFHRVRPVMFPRYPEQVLEKLDNVELQHVKSCYTVKKKPTKLKLVLKT